MRIFGPIRAMRPSRMSDYWGNGNLGYDLLGHLAIFFSDACIPIVKLRAYHLLGVEIIRQTCTRRPFELSKAPVCQSLLNNEDDQKDDADQPRRAVVCQFQFQCGSHLQSLLQFNASLSSERIWSLVGKRGSIYRQWSQINDVHMHSMGEGDGRDNPEKKRQMLVSRRYTLSSAEPAFWLLCT